MSQIRTNCINPMYCDTSCKRTHVIIGVHHLSVITRSRTKPMGTWLPFELLVVYATLRHGTIIYFPLTKILISRIFCAIYHMACDSVIYFLRKKEKHFIPVSKEGQSLISQETLLEILLIVLKA